MPSRKVSIPKFINKPSGGFKIPFRKECGFESLRPLQNPVCVSALMVDFP
jgi:hypothetical protein